MSREDRLRRILGQAPPAPQPAPEAPPAATPELPASRNVLDHPLRSKFLSRTATQPAPEPAPEVPPDVRVYPEWVGWAVRASKYLGFACVVVALLLTMSAVRQTLILADVGRSTCSTLAIADTPEAQAFWTEEDPASTVPKLRTRQFVACMKAGSPF